MKKKFFAISTLLCAILVISCSAVFANTNMINTVEQSAKNMAAGAGNMITRGVDATKNTMNDLGNGVNNMGNNIAGTITNNGNNGKTGTGTNNGATNYTATRTSANTATWLGMNATAWTWLIMGILTVAIVALVWFYGRQHDTTTHTNE